MRNTTLISSIQFATRNLFLSSLLLSISCFALTALFFELNYETIDDFFMNAIASGYIGGIPDEHILYTNFLIGLGLKFLYTTSNLLNWYGSYLCLTHILSWSAIVYSLVRLIGLKYGLWTFFYLFAVFGVYFLQNLQFTTTATLATVAGFLLYFYSFHGQKIKRTELLFGVILMIFAGLIRQQAFQLVLIILCPMLLYLFSGWRRCLKVSFITAGVLAFVFLLSVLNKSYYYKNSDWKTFYEYRFSFGFIENFAFTNTVVESPKKTYKSTGWSENDLQLFINFLVDDHSIFSYDKIMKLKPLMKEEPIHYKYTIMSIIHNFRNIHLLIILVSMLFLVKFRNTFPAIGALFLAVICIIYILFSFTMKARVSVSIIFCLVNVSLLTLFMAKNSGYPNHFRIASIVNYYYPALLVILSLLGINTLRNQYQFNKAVIVKKKELFKKQLSVLTDKSAIYVPWGYLVYFDAEGPLSNRFKVGALPRVLPIAAFAHSPLFKSTFTEFKKDGFMSVFSDKRFNVVSSIETDSIGISIPMISTYYKEHRNCDLKLHRKQNFPKAEISVFSFDGCN